MQFRLYTIFSMLLVLAFVFTIARYYLLDNSLPDTMTSRLQEQSNDGNTYHAWFFDDSDDAKPRVIVLERFEPTDHVRVSNTLPAWLEVDRNRHSGRYVIKIEGLEIKCTDQSVVVVQSSLSRRTFARVPLAEFKQGDNYIMYESSQEIWQVASDWVCE